VFQRVHSYNGKDEECDNICISALTNHLA